MCMYLKHGQCPKLNIKHTSVIHAAYQAQIYKPGLAGMGLIVITEKS